MGAANSRVTVQRARTALRRHDLSRPLTLALGDEVISEGLSVFDYGCGHGSDVRMLRERRIQASGWDPAFSPRSPKAPADVVTLSYVVNVIEDTAERVAALREAWSLAGVALIVAARGTWDARGLEGHELADGLVTRAGTFQKFFGQDELRNWLEGCLGVQPVAAAPGVFYVFREPARAQTFLASRFRQRLAIPKQRLADVLFDRHRAAFDKFMAFFAERGRLPRTEELPAAEELAHELGSVRRAFAVVRRVTGGEGWDQIVRKRVHDLLVYIALSKFGKRLPISHLPKDLQYDIRDFFGTYVAACSTADRLLFDCGKRDAVDQAAQAAPIGKVTPNALYVHVSALPTLDPLLRVYEGAARVLVGQVAGANIIKLFRRRAQVSYLAYPDFDRVAHPALATGVTVNLTKLEVDQREYSGVTNPPILHRKELFVAPSYARRAAFARLTKAEDQHGLLQSNEPIGFRDHWEALVAARGFTIRGHRLLKRPNI